MPWLTPDTPLPPLGAVTVYLPDDEYLMGCFWGAFLELATLENWEQYGSANPEDVADLFFQAYNQSI